MVYLLVFLVYLVIKMNSPGSEWKIYPVEQLSYFLKVCMGGCGLEVTRDTCTYIM